MKIHYKSAKKAMNCNSQNLRIDPWAALVCNPSYEFCLSSKFSGVFRGLNSEKLRFRTNYFWKNLNQFLFEIWNLIEICETNKKGPFHFSSICLVYLCFFFCACKSLHPSLILSLPFLILQKSKILLVSYVAVDTRSCCENIYTELRLEGRVQRVYVRIKS